MKNWKKWNMQNSNRSTCFPNAFFCYSAHFTGLDVHLFIAYTNPILQGQTYCCKTNHTTDFRLHIVRNYFSLYFVTYTPSKKFLARVLDLSTLYLMSCINFLYNEPLLENWWSLIWASCKVGVMLDHYEPNEIFDNFQCNPQHQIWLKAIK